MASLTERASSPSNFTQCRGNASEFPMRPTGSRVLANSNPHSAWRAATRQPRATPRD